MFEKKLTLSDKIFHILNYIYLLLALAVVLIPLLNVVASSLSEPGAVVSRKVTIFPIGFNIEAYRFIFSNKDLITGFLNTVYYTTAGTAINIAVTIMAAYPLARKNLPGRSAIIGFMFFTMLFSGGMIPTFLVIRDLGLYDTRWALLLPPALSVWNAMIMRTFFENTIPTEMFEAAEMDGSSEIYTLLRIVLPLSGPVIAVLVLYYSIGHWNSFMSGLIYIRTPELRPLQYVLRNILTNAQQLAEMTEEITPDEANRLAIVEVMKYAIIVAGTLPVALLYPIIQKHFQKGIMIGSIKG